VSRTLLEAQRERTRRDRGEQPDDALDTATVADCFERQFSNRAGSTFVDLETFCHRWSSRPTSTERLRQTSGTFAWRARRATEAVACTGP